MLKQSLACKTFRGNAHDERVAKSVNQIFINAFTEPSYDHTISK